MKKLLVALVLSLVSSSSYAERVKPIFNALTGKFDYVTIIDSNTIVPGAGVNVSCTNGVCTLTAAGSAASNLETMANNIRISSPTATQKFNGTANGIGINAFATGSTATLTFSMLPGNTNYIQVSNTLQSGSTFYVSSGTVNTFATTVGTFGNYRGITDGAFNLDRDGNTLGTIGQINSSPSSNRVFRWYVGVSTSDVIGTSGVKPFYTGAPEHIGKGFIFTNNVGSDIFLVDVTSRSASVFSTGTVRLYDADNSNYVALKASNTVSNHLIFTLPNTDGSSGQALLTDGNKSLYFGTVSGGGSTSTGTLTIQDTAGTYWRVTVSTDGNVVTSTTATNGSFILVDNLGNHLATETLTTPYGISSSTGVFSSSVTVTGLLTGTTIQAFQINTTSAAITYLRWADGTVSTTAVTSGGGGGGGSGSSSLAVFDGGVLISSPTANIVANASQFIITLTGAATANFTLDSSSVTLMGNVIGGDASGTLASLSVADDSHNHTSSSISGLDISADTNLAVSAPITLTNDTVGIDSSSATLAGPQINLNTSEVTGILPAANMVSTAAFTSVANTFTETNAFPTGINVSTITVSTLTITGSLIMTGGGPTYVELLETTAPGAPSTSNAHNLYFDTTDSRLKSHENGGSVVTYARASDILAHSTSTIGITFDGGGTALSATTSYITVPWTGTIQSWDIVATSTGSVVIDVKKCAGFNCDPTTSIAGTEKPTISSAWANQDTTLSSWTTSVTAGDKIGFNVDSATTIDRATVILKVWKTQ